VTLCSLVEAYRRFERNCYFHPEEWTIKSSRLSTNRKQPSMFLRNMQLDINIHVPEESTLHSNRLGNFKSNGFFFLFEVESNRVLFVRRPIFGLLYQPLMMMDDDEFGAVDGMLGRGKRSTRRKPTPVQLCPPQIPHDLTRARTRAAEVGRRKLTS
jgi:hypothetical protein